MRGTVTLAWSTLAAFAMGGAAPGTYAARAARSSATPSIPAASRRSIDLPIAFFRDRMKGGWAGQMIGVSYGSVYEFRALGQTITGPLREWKPEYIDNSIHQDDLYVEMTFLRSLELYGPSVSSRRAGMDFRDSRYSLWHANMAARENLKQGIMPPQSGHPRYNPHADDIDFQIEADLFGLISPGLFRAAGSLSDRFGSIMNYGDGIYGGRFVTAMYSRAYLEREATPAAIERCVRAGLAALPPRSEYAGIVRDVLRGYRSHPGNWLGTWRVIEKKWGQDDLCPDGINRPFNIDAKLNGAYIAIGLLFGRGDFPRTLEITTRCGQDADCNPSSAAGILGTVLGYERIPKTYTRDVPKLIGRKFDYTGYDFPGLLAACERVTKKLLAEQGGRVVTRNGIESLRIPEQRPAPPRTLERMDRFSREQLERWAKEFEARRLRSKTSAMAMDRWAKGWRLVATGNDMEIGLVEALGRNPTLATHPVSLAAPAVIERRVKLPVGKPALVFEVTSYPGEEAADWELRVRVDGEIVDRRIIHSPGQWQKARIDLTPFAGKTVTLRLENAAGGRNNWQWEAGYWSNVEIANE